MSINLTYTPDTDYVGNDTFSFTFDTPDGPVTKNICISVIAGSVTPDPFYFVDLVDQPLSTLLYSNVIGIGGINIPIPISITGGEYSINSGSWVTSAGTVVNGDSVQVRQTSSAGFETTTSTVLTVGAYSDSFDVTTIEEDIETSTLYAFNALNDNARMGIAIDDGMGNTYSNSSIYYQNAYSIPIVDGTYEVSVFYADFTGLPTTQGTAYINGVGHIVMNGVPTVVTGVVAPITVYLYLI